MNHPCRYMEDRAEGNWCSIFQRTTPLKYCEQCIRTKQNNPEAIASYAGKLRERIEARRQGVKGVLQKRMMKPREEYRQKTKDLPSPSLKAELKSLIEAGMAWAQAGFPKASDEEVERRKAICLACPEWDDTARLGLGKCKACGCTRLKIWLETEKCKLGKWNAEKIDERTHHVVQD